MHHKKQKNTIGSGCLSKDVGFEAMQRLRYLNKKPLCLQYNVINGNSKRQYYYKGKRREQSFVAVIAMGLIRLLQYVVHAVQTELWDFVVKPADELFPRRSDTSPDSSRKGPSRRRPSLSRKYINCSYRRDFGRTARITELREQRTQLCYF